MPAAFDLVFDPDAARCRDFSQQDFAWSLIVLASEVLYDDDSLRQRCIARGSDCKRINPKSDDWLAQATLIVNLFVLLHEYGHVALRHLESGTKRVFSCNGVDASLLVARHAAEYEADAFATKTLLEGSSPHDRQVTLSTVGVLLRFWDLVHAIGDKDGCRIPGTHPAAAERWRRIKHEGMGEKSRMPRDLLWSVDDVFDRLLQFVELAPLERRLA